jgi:serine/threonine-protein kinase PknK
VSSSGTNPPPRYFELLRKIAEGIPDLALLSAILDGAIGSVGAERAFLLRERRGGGFRVILARSFDGDSIPDSPGRISHHAVRRVLETRAPHFVADARRDRRYRTEEGQRTGRPALSILALPLRFRSEGDGCLYLDHRFRPIPVKGAAVEALDLWKVLLDVGIGARERERIIRAGLADGSAGQPSKDREDDGPPPQAPAEVVDLHGYIAASPDTLDLVDAARLLSRSDLPVVIEGETGTGKEILARAIHLASARSQKPFLIVPCGGLPETLLESELFGHVRGAYTGAEEGRAGILIEGDGGTVLLDEVSDMSPRLQQSLLRFLEDGRVRPLGGKEAVRIDIRVISSTHKDLEKLVAEGGFRKDLFYRLRGAVLCVPPLRERREEVLVLAAHLLGVFSRGGGREPPVLDEGARRRLWKYGWPGNVRELENEMRRLAALEIESVVEKDLSPFVRGAGTHGPAGGAIEIGRVVSEAERGAIAAALARSGGNKSRAASLLGITRKALYRRMARYGMI